MIDSHVHLRDWGQEDKETIKHGLSVAHKAGLDGVFEMPNTNPPLTSRKNIESRIRLADSRIKRLETPIFHGLYAGITDDPEQIKEVVRAYYDLFPRVVGLKMFAGHSTGNMGLITEDQQILVYETLAKYGVEGKGYDGVLAVHCEKESSLKPYLWNPEFSFTHTLARPPKAEVESVKDQIKFAHKANYRGTLHICHISVPKSLTEIKKARDYVNFKITTELTPHHGMLYDSLMESEDGLLLKMNPPLRSHNMQEQMLDELLDGNIDFIGTDHAPHTLKDKTTGEYKSEKWQGYASGIPVFPIYPHFIEKLRKKGASKELIDDITHNNITKTFGINIENTKRKPNYDLFGKYEVDVSKVVKSLL